MGCCTWGKVAWGKVAAMAALTLASAVVLANRAVADLQLCNTTPSRIGVSIGYQGSKGWATEGWWNIPAGSCETLLKGSVPSRYIYVFAIDYDRGGRWTGNNMMCTSEKSFWIPGTKDCAKRGHRRTGFFEVDTGTEQDWTIRLSDPPDDAKPR